MSSPWNRLLSGNVEEAAEVHHADVVRDAQGEEHYGEVVVTGPHASPDELGAPSSLVSTR